MLCDVSCCRNQSYHFLDSRCIDFCRATETTTAQVKVIAGQADNHDLMANYVGKQSNPTRPTGNTRGFSQTANFVDIVIR